MPSAEAPILLAGDDGVPVRVREELAAAGVPVVCVCADGGSTAAEAARAAGVPVVLGALDEVATWEAAGLDDARAVGLLGAEDLPNLSAALLVAERTVAAPIVVRQFSSDMSAGVEGILGGRGTVLSETDVAAPDLVQAALSGDTGQRVTVAGHVLEVAEVDPNDPSLVVALCNRRGPPGILPGRDALGPLVLGLVDPTIVVDTARGTLPASVARHHVMRRPVPEPARRQRASRPARARATLRVVPRRAWILVAIIALVAVASSAVFALSDHLDLVDSVYFTVTTMATVGYGDVNLATAPDWLKVYDIGFMLVSTVLLASALAFITDILVSSRIDRALGRFPRPRADHVVVCGLGKAGAAVVARLHELGVPCVGVEQDTAAVGIAVAQRLEVPVVFADARTSGVLDELHLDAARGLMAVTSDDLVNVQCGLRARDGHPGLRVVLRIFEPALAERLDRGVELGLSRSVSALAAPAFAAALLGRPLVRPVTLSGVALRVLETEIPAGSELAGRRIRDLHAEGEVHVLAVDGAWAPRDDIVLAEGAAVAVVATREMTDELLLPRPVAA